MKMLNLAPQFLNRVTSSHVQVNTRIQMLIRETRSFAFIYFFTAWLLFRRLQSNQHFHIPIILCFIGLLTYSTATKEARIGQYKHTVTYIQYLPLLQLAEVDFITLSNKIYSPFWTIATHSLEECFYSSSPALLKGKNLFQS